MSKESVFAWSPQVAGMRTATTRFFIETNQRREQFSLVAGISQAGKSRIYHVSLLDLCTTAVRTATGESPSWSAAETEVEHAARLLIAEHVELRRRHMLCTHEIRSRSDVVVRYTYDEARPGSVQVSA